MFKRPCATFDNLDIMQIEAFEGCGHHRGEHLEGLGTPSTRHRRRILRVSRLLRGAKEVH